jgi:hypothetical protein
MDGKATSSITARKRPSTLWKTTISMSSSILFAADVILSSFYLDSCRIDIPIYFVMGLNDTLIEPISVITQYAALKDRHPDRAYLKAFSRLGRILQHLF